MVLTLVTHFGEFHGVPWLLWTDSCYKRSLLIVPQNKGIRSTIFAIHWLFLFTFSLDLWTVSFCKMARIENLVWSRPAWKNKTHHIRYRVHSFYFYIKWFEQKYCWLYLRWTFWRKNFDLKKKIIAGIPIMLSRPARKSLWGLAWSTFVYENDNMVRHIQCARKFLHNN